MMMRISVLVRLFLVVVVVCLLRDHYSTATLWAAMIGILLVGFTLGADFVARKFVGKITALQAKYVAIVEQLTEAQKDK